MTKQSKKYLTIFVVIGVILLVGWVIGITKTPKKPVAENWADNLLPVDSIFYQFSDNHFHGLGYDSKNERLFVATHYGLFVWQNGKLYQLGKNRDDFMGFSLNQRDPNIIYTSGHPRAGGNLGVMKSVDAGLTFERIFSNIGGGRVDFHSMALSYANQDILYGFYQGRLYHTKDSGKNWEFAKALGLSQQGFCWGVPCLAADPQEENVLYAGTPVGLAVSHDFGETWETVKSDAGAITAVGIDSQNNRKIFAFTENHGVAVSENGGQSWTAKNNGLQLGPQEFVFAFSFDPNNPNKIFLGTTGQQVFITQDGGETWGKVL